MMGVLKHKVSSIIYNKDGFTLQKIMVILAMVNALSQVAFGRIHNEAAYKVSSTVAIFTFINQIALILMAVSLMRIHEKKKYYVFSILLFLISTITMIVYIVTMQGDIYYQTALNGGYSYEDAIKIVYAIDDSVNFVIFAIVMGCIEMGLFIAEIVIRRRRKHGLSNKGRD
ncbi:MAG: hypothetical protein K2N64_03610 [Anaeroplasmataceae bacterium]|nr:hypothetical protein [Anaeroplasmataceae bacterium]